MLEASLLFPHQLFKEPKNLDLKIPVYLIEDELFFHDSFYKIKMCRRKIDFHKSCLDAYQKRLEDLGFGLERLIYAEGKSSLEQCFELLSNKSVHKIRIIDPTDFILEKRIRRLAEKYSIEILWFENPGFINTREENKKYKAGKKRWFMADFYQHQRKRLNLLVDETNQPEGGSWSFDEENRKKIPAREITNIPLESLDYPINHKDAEAWLNRFIEERFERFGPYEDALVPGQSVLYHSVLTPLLNVGLLEPQQVIEKILLAYKEKNISLASTEGFIRQVIGWREFMRATYEDLGVKMRTTNHWKHTRSMLGCFYDGTTGVDPVDDVIQRLNKTGYANHIERLMVLGGFMFLCEIEPDDIYKWFMELFIDSYDWVMVPNVYAMSQNADGGLITTKPYFSGSNYIMKMGHYKKGDWNDIWDALYWRWILKHKDTLIKNPRWAMMCRMAEKMDEEKKQKYLDQAEDYLKKLV